MWFKRFCVIVDRRYDLRRRKVKDVLSAVADVRGTVKWIRNKRSTYEAWSSEICKC